MNTRSRALRLVLAATLTLGMTALGLGLAESASANTGFPSSSPVTPIAGHEVDTGVIVLKFETSQAGLTAAVATPDPADSTAVSTVTGVIGADGSVSIRDFAGPAAVYIKAADGQVHELGGAPLSGTVTHRQAASIYRGETGSYSYSPDTDTFTGSAGGLPTPPSATDIVNEIPTTHSVETTQGLEAGNSGTLTYSVLSLNGTGDPNFSSNAVSYAYGPLTQRPGIADPIGSVIIRRGTLHVIVPALYSYGIHRVASFDPYGRLLAITTVGDPTPVAAPAGSSAAAHPLDTGTVIIQVSNVMFGTVFTSTVADPTAPGTSSVVSATVGHGGLVALTNFAGYSRVDVGGGSGDDNQNPATFRSDVNFYRAQTVVYGYPSVSNTSDDPFGINGGVAPAPVIPTTAAEAEALTPVATSTVSPTSWQAGSDLTLDFANVTPTSIVPNDSLTVHNYVYSDPTSLGSSTMALMNLPEGGGFAYSFTIPGAFTSGGHIAASFDQFGRLVALDRLNGATSTSIPPSTTPAGPITPITTPGTGGTPASASSASTPAATTVAALANTGQTDVVPAGIATLVLFCGGALLLIVSGRRRASRD
ncbi:MAG: hypothetical protein JWQ19_1363 [Subtercola sp.]|nr:hypothetical protein [Subtercola sp.]